MDMWNKIKAAVFTYRDLTAMGFSNIFSTVILGVFWFIIAKIVNVEDYGFLSYQISMATVFAAVALPGITNTIIVHAGKDPKIRAPIFALSIILLVVASTIFYFIFHNFASSLYVIGYPLFALLFADLISRNLFSNYSKIIVIQRVLSIVLSVLFYYIVGIDGIILGLSLSFFIYFYKLYGILKESPIKFSLLKPYQNFMITNYGIDLSKIMSTQIDKLIIFPIFGFITLGNYFFAYQILSVLIVIPSTVFQYILPQESVGKSFKFLKIATTFLVSGISVLVIVFAPYVIPFLFPKYVDSVLMVQIMILSIIPLTMNTMYISKFLTGKKSKVVFIGSLIFIIVQVSLILIFGRLLGVNGIALALLMANIAEFVYLYLQNRVNSNSIFTNH
jgi:O-antigen/teichoic acid export membrane protein